MAARVSVGVRRGRAHLARRTAVLAGATAASLLFIFHVVPSTTSASGKQYYVSLSGSDDHLGTTLATAWRTVGYAVDHVQPGDTIYVVPGDYGAENVTITVNGTALAPITLTRYGTAGEIILTAAGSMVGTGIDLSADHWRVEYVHTRNYFTGFRIGSAGEHNVLRYCHGEGNGTAQNKDEYRGIYVVGSNNRIEHCRGSKVGTKGGGCANTWGCGSGMRIEGDNNYVLDFRAWSNGHFGIAIDRDSTHLARGNVVDGGEFWDNKDTSIAVAEGADTTIKNVLVHDSQSGFRAYREALNTTIESCVIRNVTSYGIRILGDGLVASTKVEGTCGTAGVCVGCESAILTKTGLNLRCQGLDVSCDSVEYRLASLNLGGASLTIRDPASRTYRIRTAANTACGDPIVEYTKGRVFVESSGTYAASYQPSGSRMSVSCTKEATLKMTAYDMSALPSSGSASVTVKTFDTSAPPGSVLVDYTAKSIDGNQVEFAVWGLQPGHYYLVKRDLVGLVTVRADASGLIRFKSSEWPAARRFTVTESSAATDAGADSKADSGADSGADRTPPAISLQQIVVNGSVDDPSVTKVDINGVAVPVTSGRYSHAVDVSSRSTITITAMNAAGEKVARTLSVK